MISQQLEQTIKAGLAPMNRRRFMAATSQSVLAVGLGSLVAACSDHPMGAPEAGAALSSDQVAFFQRLAQILLPTDGTAMAPLAAIPVLKNLDDLFASMDASVRSDLGMAIDLFEHASLVSGWHFSRFSRLSDEDAIRYIDQWQSGHSIQLGIVTVLKKLVYASYWRDENTWGPVQFDGPVSEKWGLPSLGETPLPPREKA